jgi:hypothetical protein
VTGSSAADDEERGPADFLEWYIIDIGGNTLKLEGRTSHDTGKGLGEERTWMNDYDRGTSYL